MARILAYTSPAAGHLFPLVPGLLARGPLERTAWTARSPRSRSSRRVTRVRG